MSKITIKEVLDRNVLSEGRNSNMGFAFLKKIKQDEYHTVNPISPCKDYLAEVTFTENTGIGTNGCGLKYPKKQDCFDKEVAYMVITIQKNQGGTTYSYNVKGGYQQDIDNLKANYKAIQALLNGFEDRIGIKGRTTVEEANNGYYLVTLPIDWTISTYSVSLFSLLLRAGQLYDGKQDSVEFINSYPTGSLDTSLMNSAKPKIKVILDNNRLPDQKQESISQASKVGGYFSPHGLGIVSWDSKYDKPLEIEVKAKKVTKKKITKKLKQLT